MSTLTWVIGSGGLLGSHVVRSLPRHLPSRRWCGQRLPWSDAAALDRRLAEDAGRFAADLADPALASWAVLWCAGTSAVGTPEAALAAETAALGRLLHHLAAALGPHRRDLPGMLFLASSAGGVYGGSSARPLTEEVPCEPLSAYGRHKLAQERLLAAWAPTQPRVSTLVARISNLYGPGQNLTKSQGLPSQLTLAQIHHQPVHIYVPLDTQRDFLYVDDCAELVGRSLARLCRLALAGPPLHVVKILAAETETSLAEILGACKRLRRQPPRIVLAPTPRSRQQPASLRFRSVVWPELRAASPTSLPVGLQRLYADHLALHLSGRLPRPHAG